MKKKTYSFVASFLMMLVVTLTSCEKFALDETSTIPHDASANVTFHVSMGPTNRRKWQLKSTAVRPTMANPPAVKPSLWKKYVPDSHSASSTEKRKVKEPQHPGYRRGIRPSFQSRTGRSREYRVVIIGHNGTGNCTISSPEKVKFASNKLTDTFYYYGKLILTDGEETEESIELKRAVAQFKVHITDTEIPAEAHSIKFYYTGGSSTLDATTGYGCVNSRQTETFKFSQRPERLFRLYLPARRQRRLEHENQHSQFRCQIHQGTGQR